MRIARSQDWEATLLGLVTKQCYFLCTGLNAARMNQVCWVYQSLPLRPWSDSLHRLGVLDVLEDSVITQLCKQFMLQVVRPYSPPRQPMAQNCPSHPQCAIEPPDAGWCPTCESEMEWPPGDARGPCALSFWFISSLSGVLDFLSGWFLWLVTNIYNFPWCGPRFFLTPVTVGNSFSIFSLPSLLQIVGRSLL